MSSSGTMPVLKPGGVPDRFASRASFSTRLVASPARQPLATDFGSRELVQAVLIANNETVRVNALIGSCHRHLYADRRQVPPLMRSPQHFSVSWDCRWIATLLNHVGKGVIFLAVEEGAKRYLVDPLAAFMQVFDSKPDALACWIFEMVELKARSSINSLSKMTAAMISRHQPRIGWQAFGGIKKHVEAPSRSSNV